MVGLVKGTFDHLTFGKHVLQAFAAQSVATWNEQGLIAGTVAVLDEADLTNEYFFNCGVLIMLAGMFRFSLTLDQV